MKLSEFVWSPWVALVGLVLVCVGVVGYVTLAMFAALYVPLCQQGAEWSSALRCRSIVVQGYGAVGAFGVGVVLVVAGIVVRKRLRSRRR